uniref:Uncharacterized protein n=1 Tax=Stegastes partitus TaxID=144197 RepID=A0A3B4ZQB2_9TELE
DMFLLLYCIAITSLLFREKVSYSKRTQGYLSGHLESNSQIYQELERPMDADPYQVLQPSKRKVHLLSFQTSDQNRGAGPYESFALTELPPPALPLR